MPIWKLSPINEDSKHWDASEYKGIVIIRAETEKDARDLASSAFGRAAPVCIGQPNAIVPWGIPDVVSCIELKDIDYPEKGGREILEPKNHR